MYRFLIPLAFVSASLPALQSVDARRPLDLCTLITEWQQFSGTTVRVKALLKEGAEQSALSDPSCRDGKPLVFVSPTKNVKGKKAKLRQILRYEKEFITKIFRVNVLYKSTRRGYTTNKSHYTTTRV